MFKLIRSTIPLLALFTGLLLISCAGTPDKNPVVKNVQDDYRKILNDSLVVENAPQELRKAREAVADVRRAVAGSESQKIVQRKALIASQRITIAREKAKMRGAENELRSASRELETLVEEAGYAASEAEEYAKRLTNFNAKNSNRGIVLRFINLEFDSEKTSLKSSAERPVNELAGFLNAYQDRTVLIEGHTDNTGTTNFNQTLSQQRAGAVRDALISRGVDGARITAIGLGEQYPIANNDTEAGRDRNRRVDVIISHKGGTIPAR